MYHIFICFKSTELHQVAFAILYQISIWPIISDLQYAPSPFLEHMYMYIYPYILFLSDKWNFDTSVRQEMCFCISPPRSVWVPRHNCLRQEDNSSLSFPADTWTCRFVLLWVCFPWEAKAETSLGYWSGGDSRGGMKCMWHFTFCVNILRKTPGFLKLVEEIYGLLRKK